jgi:hypothetical protein
MLCFKFMLLSSGRLHHLGWLPGPHQAGLPATSSYCCCTLSSTCYVLFSFLQGGCIIRAGFLDRIKQAYQRDPSLPSLLVDPPFAKVCEALVW